jgi:DNA-binding transcriptional ArsR family regulator
MRRRHAGSAAADERSLEEAMSMNQPPQPGVQINVELFKALGDPVRWEMIRRIAASEELAWSALDHPSVSKPTISYHIRSLVQAGLISVRKEGRFAYYSLRRDVLQDLTDKLCALSHSATENCAVNREEAGCDDLKHRPVSCSR